MSANLDLSKGFKKLGEVLVENAGVSKKDIDLAVSLQKKEKKPIGQILVEKGIITWNEIAKAISKQYRIPLIEDISNLEIQPRALSVFSKANAENWRFIPFEITEDDRIKILTDQVNNIISMSKDIRFMVEKTPDFYITSTPNIDLLLKEYFGSNIEIVKDLGKEDTEERETESFELGDITYSGKEETEEDSSPVINSVNQIIFDAVSQNASDIHIEPFEKMVRVRYRIDGLLRKITEYPIKVHSSVVSRIKILAKLDIAERRLPQDGKFFRIRDGEQYDFRISTMPSVHGEKIVMRILRVSNSTKRLTDIGFSDHNMERVKHLLEYPYGIILVSGPTGSGKSTTLVGILNHLKSITKNIVTIEDPVEYSISGITQCQVHPEIGLNFARFLRSILRQDPDMIMVGEIRDKETAQLAIEASMTGHLVFSTLHTNTAAAAVSRLLNLGIEPDMLGVSLLGVISQRLVRTLCSNCKKTEIVTDESIINDARKIMKNSSEFLSYSPVGCQECRNSGYQGRTAIHEVLINNTKIRELMVDRASKSQIEDVARKSGMRTMFQDGIEKSLLGITSLNEVRRVVVNE